MKHAAPKKKAGSVPVSRTIATVAVATAAAGAAAPAVAAELPHPDLGLGDLPTTDMVDLPDHDALVSDLSDVVAGPRGVDLPGVEVPEVVPNAPADLTDLAEAGAVIDQAAALADEAEAVTGAAMPASIPPVEQVAPDYRLPGFAGQGDVVPGVLATAEVVKGSAEGAVQGAPALATDAVDPAVQGVVGEVGGAAGVVDGATEATDVVDGATGAVDGVAGAVSGVRGDDVVGGVTGQVEDAATGAAGTAGLDGVLGTATGLVG
ncbi:hypothetical protein [Myceligenerans salitolerans]|uniref:Uncharacterized protein n=1 Tax=Myceligenerans salitolerans TaxID=1230528 RepID=A0ABS3I9Q7_9MICO|nr:hypothetical protein [Myceligenerans salitolerans]MBO0609735.1 hypothetical protein [Myceligenerans salitolerans]